MKGRRELLKPQESPEEELKLVKQAKEEAEKRVVNLERELGAKEERIIELEKKLSTAQQKLDEYGLKEPSDWVISREEIRYLPWDWWMGNSCTGKIQRLQSSCETVLRVDSLSS